MGNKIKLKTNLMCEGCKSRITPFLDGEKQIKSWQINLEDENKVLTVEGEGISGEDIIEILKKAGYKGSPLI